MSASSRQAEDLSISEVVVARNERHLSHAPLADEGGDLIVAESGANFESHKL